jgi:hypothetical protein
MALFETWLMVCLMKLLSCISCVCNVEWSYMLKTDEIICRRRQSLPGLRCYHSICFGGKTPKNLRRTSLACEIRTRVFRTAKQDCLTFYLWGGGRIRSIHCVVSRKLYVLSYSSLKEAVYEITGPCTVYDPISAFEPSMELGNLVWTICY